MMTSLFVLAESGGLTWTPETYYIVVAVVQLVAILLLYRLMNLPAEHNTFSHAAMVVVGANATAYFTMSQGVLSVILTSFALFILLALMTRGDVPKTIVGWFVAMGVYWAVVMGALYAEEPDTEQLEEAFVQQLGPLPYAMMEGGLDAEPMDRDGYRELLREAEDED